MLMNDIIENIAVSVTGLPEPLIFQQTEVVQVKSRADYLRSRYLRKYRNIKRRSVTDIELPVHIIPAHEICVGDWVLLPRRPNLVPIHLKPEQLYAAGFWLAEGHYVKSTGKKTFGAPVGIALTNTHLDYLSQIEPVLRDWFPASKSNTRTEQKRNEKHKNKYVLEVWSREAGDFFFQNFGEYSGGKYISEEIYQHSGLLPLVCGFIDGDGCQFSKGRRVGYVVLITTSRNLAYQLRQILLDEGIWTSLQTKAGQKENHARQYSLSIRTAYVHKLIGAAKVNAPETERTNHLAIPAPEGFYARVKSVAAASNT